MLKDRCTIINFKDFGDERGKLVVIEGGQTIPFDIKRVFYIYGSYPEVIRWGSMSINGSFSYREISKRCIDC